MSTVKNNQTDYKFLFTKTLGQIEYYYRDGRINQDEFELYTHFWNKTHDKENCNCAFCLIERGEKEKLYQWFNEIGYNARKEFFQVLNWNEGNHYCMADKNYYDHTGFICLQNTMNRLYEGIISKSYSS